MLGSESYQPEVDASFLSFVRFVIDEDSNAKNWKKESSWCAHHWASEENFQRQGGAGQTGEQKDDSWL